MKPRKGPLTDKLPSRGRNTVREDSQCRLSESGDVTLHAVGKFALFGAVTAPEITSRAPFGDFLRVLSLVNIELLQPT